MGISGVIGKQKEGKPRISEAQCKIIPKCAEYQ